jgi:iron complex outermembrane receptor protein
MFQVKLIARCVTAACAGFAVAPQVLAQQPPQPQQPQQLERVEITGSAIRRTQQEGPAPVEIITRKEIERTGATSLNELIKSISTIDIFDQGELASNSPSGSGTSNLAIRGLSSLNVLVLLNGRRLPVNALYDSSGAGAAVDINMIPISAIERIEILKDGGSAIYGADAVAGVINFITKKDFQGIEVRSGYGKSSRNDADETNAGLAFGYGDLSKDRFNAFLAIDYFKRDPLFRKDREISRTADGRRFGGSEGRSSFAPTGNIVNPITGAFTGVNYRPCAPEDFNGRCRYDFNASLLTAYNGADRLSGMAIGTFQLTPSVRAFGELTYAKTEDKFELHPAPNFINVPILNASQLPFEDPTVPGTVVIAGRFMQAGPRTTDRESTLTNLAFGAEGTSFNLDWKVTAGRGVSEVTNQDSNYLDEARLAAAIAAGQVDPTVITNNQSVVDGLKVRPLRVGESTVTYVNLQLSGEAFSLPAGPLQYAVGASSWKEDLQDTPDALTQAGAVFGSIAQAAVNADRNAKAVFAELSIPVARKLEAQLAVRYDDYPNATATSPKAALKFTPLSNLLLRASYTESFRAPSLKQLFGAQEQGAATLTDPELCAIVVGPAGGCDIPYFSVTGSNPNLQPEKGKTYNVGLVFDAGNVYSGSIDFWRITKENDITSPTDDSAIRQGFFGRDANNRILVFANLNNIAGRTTSGFDLDNKFRFPGTALGTITIRDTFSYLYHNKTRAPDSDWAEFAATYATPRWRNVLTLTSETGPWTTQFLLRSVAGFWDQDTPWPITTTRYVGAHEELDAQLEHAGFRNLRLIGGVKNLLDNDPPFSNKNLTDNTYSQMGFAELYSSRGRFYYVSAVYKFR